MRPHSDPLRRCVEYPGDTLMPAVTSTKRVGQGVLTRQRGKLVVMSAATLICLYLCSRFIQPFLPALVWSVTVSVVTWPALCWLSHWIRSAPGRAAVAVSSVAAVLFVPLAVLAYFAALQIAESIESINTGEYQARFEETLVAHHRLADAWQQANDALNLPATLASLLERVRNAALAMLSGSAYTLVQILLTLFILFYLYRDGDKVLQSVRQLAPLTDRETDRLLDRLGDTIHATVFGTIAVAIIQGLMGGVMFWWIGLPAPALWGTVMGLLAIVPYLGTFVVWAPAALLLFAGGEWGKALAVVAWGAIAIGLIDNLLYPVLVGNRLKQHTVVAFIAIVGGIAVFGASGIILGPAVVTLTVFLLEVWRHRTAQGTMADAA